MTLEQIIDHLKSDPAISQNITHWQVIPSRACVPKIGTAAHRRDASMIDFPNKIDERLKSALQQKANACIATLCLIHLSKGEKYDSYN